MARVPLQLPLLPASDFCQRWREQRVVWRHRHAAGETFIPLGYEVAPIGRPQTADFLRDHHYLHKLPANRFRFGLLRGADLVGIAVLGPGMPHTLRALFPDLEPAAESLVLDRFALLDEVKALGETWFLARVFALLRTAGIEAVATCSDPWPPPRSARPQRPRRTYRDGFPGRLRNLHRADGARNLPPTTRHR